MNDALGSMMERTVQVVSVVRIVQIAGVNAVLKLERKFLEHWEELVLKIVHVNGVLRPSRSLSNES